MNDEKQEIPSWARAALEVSGVSTSDEEPKADDWDSMCDSCGQSGVCYHPHDQVVERLNGSRVCLRCNQLLHGQQTKDEERCALCRRLWCE